MPDETNVPKQATLAISSKPQKSKTILASKNEIEKLEPELTENALRVVEKRYLQKDKDHNFLETPAQMFHRVATSIAKVDLEYGATGTEVKAFEDKIYQTMCKMEFLPNSPTFWGAGTKSGQLSACFVLPIEDNMKSILKTQMDMGLIHKSGGGTGFSFSRLRPNHSPVGSTGGVASGPLGFMQMYNDTSNIIKEGGRRRGANMGMLRVDHPDIIEFITYKETEGALSNFNISVAVTDKFMKAVEDDTDFDLIDPSDKSVTNTLKARDIFEKIVAGAWRNGEPGIIFIDEINRLSPVQHLGEVESTNPCVAGNTFVSTENGLIQIKDLAENYSKNEIKILTDEVVFGNIKPDSYFNGPIAVLGKTKHKLSLNKTTAVFKTGKKQVYKLTTESGYEISATADHKFYTNLGWVLMSDIVPGSHSIYLQPEEGYFNQNLDLPFDVKKAFTGKNGRKYVLNLPDKWSEELGEILGLIVGDGWLISQGKNCRLGITFSSEDENMMTRAQKILNEFYLKKITPIKRSDSVYHLSYHSQYLVDFFLSLGVTSDHAATKRVPKSIFTAPKSAVIGFLKGLFSADGTIGWQKDKNSRTIRLTSKSINLLKDVQILLLNLGIKSKIYDRSRPERFGFEYETVNGVKKNYRLDGQLFEIHIGKENIKLFLEKIGFLNSKHQAITEELLKANFYSENFEEKVAKIEQLGIEDVYDLTEPYTQSFIANGIVISNCGEQPLLPYESCNLGSINVSKMVVEKNGKKEVDWDKFKETIELAAHFLDNVIDANKFPIPEIEEMTKKSRKIGLGVMGFADMLLQLNIPYNSEAGLKMAEKIMKFLSDTSHEYSMKVAKIRGSFPAFKGSLWDKKGVDAIRNATTTTIAPTGTIGMIASASSGIEPIFALVYTKTVMDGVELVEVNNFFKTALQNEGIYSEELVKKVAANRGSVQDIDEIPESIKKVFVTAGDITPEWHIKMQAALQKNTDNAISKTINFPFEATISDVEESYKLAWKLKTKGLTVYRDGSRLIQVLTTGTKDKEKETEKKEEVEPHTVIATGIRIIPRERPDVIHGSTYKVKTAYGKLYVTINDDDEGEPFEMFSTLGKTGGFFASNTEAICRLISLALRAGIDPQEVIDQIKGIRGPQPTWGDDGKMILSLPDAIGQLLERHINREQQNLALDFKIAEPKIIDEEQMAESMEAAKISTPAKSQKSLADMGEAPACQECGAMLEFTEGCLKCPSCGYSKCS